MFGSRRKLERQLQHALGALRYYADESTWKRRGKHRKGDPVQYARAPFTHDHGSRARTALRLIDAPMAAAPSGLSRLFGRRPVDLGRFSPTVPTAHQHLSPSEATRDVLARSPGMDTE